MKKLSEKSVFHVKVELFHLIYHKYTCIKKVDGWNVSKSENIFFLEKNLNLKIYRKPKIC